GALLLLRAVVVVDGDEEPLGVEAVHLDQTVVVGSGAVDDDEDEVVVVVDLRPLVEMLGVLDGKWVEFEDFAKDLEVPRLGLVEVEPEEVATRQQLLDGFAAEMDLRASISADDVADRRAVSIQRACLFRTLRLESRPGAVAWLSV